MKNIDIEDKKREIPYRVPDGFFDTFPDKMMERIRKECMRQRIRRIWISVGSIAAMIIGGVLFVRLGFQDTIEKQNYQELASMSGSTIMGQYIRNLSDEELELQLQLFELDVTLTLDNYE